MAKANKGKGTKETAPVVDEETFEDELEDLEETDTDDEDLDDADEDEDEDSDLEELEEEDEDEAPAPKGKKATKSTKAAAPKREPIEFGSAWLAEHIKEQTGESVDARGLRVLLRKMAKQGDGPVSREVGTDRTRYQWTGPKDPAVVAIVKAVKGGALQKAKSDGLAAARAAKEAKKAAREQEAAAAETKATKAKGKKTAPAEEPAPKAKKKAKAKA